MQSNSWSPRAVSCGIPFLCIPVRNRDTLRRAQLRLDVLPAVLGTYWTQSVYVFTADPELPGSDWRVRMLRPPWGCRRPCYGRGGSRFCRVFGG
ncbi:MAG: hypothetical protein R3F37_22800 [Candidatus Competibacteraceae bacterium]